MKRKLFKPIIYTKSMKKSRLAMIGLAGLAAAISSNVRAEDEYPVYELIRPVEVRDADIYDIYARDFYRDSGVEEQFNDRDSVIPEPSYLVLLGASYLALRRRR